MIIKIVILLSVLGLTCCKLIGGINSMNMSDPKIEKKLHELANFALKEIARKRISETGNQSVSNDSSYSLVKIVSARSQIVSGVKYFMTLQFRDSKCLRNVSTKQRRSLGSSSCVHPEQCEVEIWEQVWLNHTELLSVVCKQKSGPLLGSRQRISNKDEYALKALDFAVTKMNTDAVNERAYFKPAQIFNTYKQVVNGFKYTFVFKYAPTNCEKHEDLSILRTDDCAFVTQPAASDGHSNSSDVPRTRNCKVTVHDQPWLTSNEERYKITNVNCF